MPVRNVLKEVYDKSGYADLIDTVGAALRDLSGDTAAIIKWFQNGSKGSIYHETGLPPETIKTNIQDLYSHGVLVENSEGKVELSQEGLKKYLESLDQFKRESQWEENLDSFNQETQVNKDLADLSSSQQEDLVQIENAEKPLALLHPKQEDFEKAFLEKFPDMHKHIRGLLEEGPCPLDLILELLPTPRIQKSVFQKLKQDLMEQNLDVQDIKGLLYIVDKKQSENMNKIQANLATQVARMLLHEGVCPFDIVKHLANDPSSAAASDFKSLQKNTMSKVRLILEKYMKDFKLEGTTYVLRDLPLQELEDRREQRRKKNKTSSRDTCNWFDTVLQGELDRLTLRHRAALISSSVKSPLFEE